jgi:hypothetical protein
MTTITSNDIICDLEGIAITTIRQWMYQKRIPGRVGRENKQFLYDLDVYNAWKKEKYPKMRYKYLRRVGTGSVRLHVDLSRLCLKLTGVKISGQIIQRHVYRDLPVTASMEDIEKWFETPECQFMVDRAHEYRTRIDDKKNHYTMPCGNAMKHSAGSRCKGFWGYPECIKYEECLKFFALKNWFGWEEV